MPTRFDDIIRDVTLLTPDQLVTLRGYIDGILKINITQGWRDKISRRFVKECLGHTIKEFRVVDQIQIHRGILYLIQGSYGHKDSDRWTVFWDGIPSKKVAERQPENMEVFEADKDHGETIVICTPIPKDIVYFRISNTTGYYRMVNGVLHQIDEIDYKMAGFEP